MCQKGSPECQCPLTLDHPPERYANRPISPVSAGRAAPKPLASRPIGSLAVGDRPRPDPQADRREDSTLFRQLGFHIAAWRGR